MIICALHTVLYALSAFNKYLEFQTYRNLVSVSKGFKCIEQKIQLTMLR